MRRFCPFRISQIFQLVPPLPPKLLELFIALSGKTFYGCPLHFYDGALTRNIILFCTSVPPTKGPDTSTTLLGVEEGVKCITIMWVPNYTLKCVPYGHNIKKLSFSKQLQYLNLQVRFLKIFDDKIKFYDNGVYTQHILKFEGASI